MKTNTHTQAKELKRLKIKQKQLPFEMDCRQGWWQDSGNGPCLGVEILMEVLIKVRHFPDLIKCESFEVEILHSNGTYNESANFPVTKNHAEDLCNIAIWLLKNGHVSADQVNLQVNK